MKYIANTDIYLTFLTHNDSYMEKVPNGTILDMVNGNLTYKGRQSIDNEVGMLYHKHIKEWGANPTGDGTALEMRRADDLSL